MKNNPFDPETIHHLDETKKHSKDLYIARIQVLERHADGANRNFTITRALSGDMTVRELFEWRKNKVHDPVNGEFAEREILITPDDTTFEY